MERRRAIVGSGFICGQIRLCSAFIRVTSAAYIPCSRSAGASLRRNYPRPHENCLGDTLPGRGLGWPLDVDVHCEDVGRRVRLDPADVPSNRLHTTRGGDAEEARLGAEHVT